MVKSFAKAIQKVVRLQEAEERPFFYLFVHAFFNGLGIALAYAAINIIIIKKQGIEILPWLYIASSILMILAGIFYNKLEHAYPPKKVFIFSLLFCVTWAFAMRFLLGPNKSLLFIGMAYGTYYLILVLTNLDLWGSAALVFNVRQSKRLFGPLSFAESIGGIIGYGLSPILVTMMAVQNMMILSGLSFLVSVVVLYNLRNQYLQADHHHDHEEIRHSLHEPIQVGAKNFWSRLFHNNAYIKQLSIVILLSTLIYYTLTYGFLNRVEVQFKSLTEIAWFIGVFLSIAKILNLVIKFIFSSHIFTKLGVHFGFYLLPIIIIFISIIGLFLIIPGVDNSMFYIYLFSALYFFDKLFRSSLSKPSYLILFQPLAPNMRLSGHTIAKGYFEPFAMGLAGLVILLAKYLGWFSLQSLVVYILVLSLMWFLSCRTAIRYYLSELKTSLRNRMFGSSSFQLSKNELKIIVETKLNSADEVDQLYALSLLDGKISSDLALFHYRQLLTSADDMVLYETLKGIEDKKIDVGSSHLTPLLLHEHIDVRSQAAYSLAATEGLSSIEPLQNLIEEKPELNNSFIGALIKYAGIEGTLAVGHRLMDLVRSSTVEDRVLAASIIDKTDNPEYNSILLKFLKDDDTDVVNAAIKACGSTASTDLLELVFNHLEQRKYLPSIKQCAKANPDKAYLQISRQYATADDLMKRRLVDVSGHIYSESNTLFLLQNLHSTDKLLLQRIIRNLSLQDYRALEPSHKKIIKSAISSNLKTLKSMVDLFNNLDTTLHVKQGLKSELHAVDIKNILGLLSFIYDVDTIEKITRHVALNANSTDIANAVELLENLLPNSWSNKFIPALEVLHGGQMKKHSTPEEGIQSFIELISKDVVTLSDYLFGLLIRTARELDISLPVSFVNVARSKHSKIINEELNLTLG